MCVGCLSDVGIVIKNRFLNFISKLQTQHYSSDLLDLCYCEMAAWCSDCFFILCVFSV